MEILRAVIKKKWRTDRRTNGLTIPSLTSTDVENCQRGQVTTPSTSGTLQLVQPVQPVQPVELDNSMMLLKLINFIVLSTFKNLKTFQHQKLGNPSLSSYVSILSTIICIIRLTKPVKQEEITKKMLIIHKSRAFLAPQVLSVVKYHLSLSEYAISDQSNQPNWKEWPKTSFLTSFWLFLA